MITFILTPLPLLPVYLVCRSLARLLAGEAVSADGVRSALLSTFQELFPDVEMRVLERDEAPALEQSVAEVEELWRAEQEGLQ